MCHLLLQVFSYNGSYHVNHPKPATGVQPSAQLSAFQQGHDVSLDALRIVATLMVLLIHISGKGFAGLIQHWWAVNTFESVSRACVPIFFMITGALLLPRSHTVLGVLKRVWRIVFALVAWSLVFLIYAKVKGSDSVPLAWPATILKSPVAGHLWYLYSLIAAYFFMPVLAGFIKTSTVKLQCFTLLIWFIAASVIPFTNRFIGEAKLGVDIQFFYIYPAYMLAGALLYQHFSMNLPRFILCAVGWVAATAGTAFFTWFYSKSAPVNTELYYEYFAPLVVVAALTGFCAFRYLGTVAAESCPAARSALVFLGGLSFGVYLIHPMIIWEFEAAGYGWNFTNPWLAIPALLVGVSVVSGTITFVIRKTPIVRAIIPG